MKYRLTKETTNVGSITLYRIECVTAFGNVKVGDRGGWVESKKNLSQYGNAWVYGNAKVYDDAEVYGNARVYDDAEVYGNAKVSGNAEVYVYAMVSGNAWVCGDAKVYGNAKVYDDAKVYGDAKVCGDATVSGNAEVSGDAMVSGNAEVCGGAEVSGNADYIVFKNWWSSGRYFTWTRSNNKWRVGCFYGTGEELIAKAYKDSDVSGKEYERVVNYVKSIQEEKKCDTTEGKK